MRAIPPTVAAILVAACASSAAAQAQSTAYEVSPFAGYVFGGAVAPATGDAAKQQLEDHAFGGVRAAVFPSPTLGVELELSRVASSVAIGSGPCTAGGASCDYGATLTYALVTGIVRGSGTIRPYAGLGGGVCRLTTLFGREFGTRSADRAAATIAVGVDVALSDAIGLRLDARGYATDIQGLNIGPPCTTFEQVPPGGNILPVPCSQEHWLKNTALSAGVVFRF